MFAWLRQLITAACLGCLTTVAPAPLHAQDTGLAGRILLQVEAHGEAWYVYPHNGRRYYLGRPADAFAIMRALSLGISNADFARVQSNMPARLRGRILLKTEDSGRAYYVHPTIGTTHYLGRPADAFAIMRQFGLGSTNANLAAIPVGVVSDVPTALPVRVAHQVPFTPQAPFGDWNDARQQDGCEEASALMAVRWARGQNLTPQEALDEIIAAAEYQKRNWNNFTDTSARDTVDRIIKGYFNYDRASVLSDVTITDIQKQLAAGNIVIAPFNGQALGNPYFTPPGPARHMAVITGYDKSTDEFITNDPGTRHGEGFRYATAVLFAALREYPTGDHETIAALDKTIIVLHPSGAID